MSFEDNPADERRILDEIEDEFKRVMDNNPNAKNAYHRAGQYTSDMSYKLMAVVANLDSVIRDLKDQIVLPLDPLDARNSPITLQWLHNNLPEFWERRTRGIESGDWSIHQAHHNGPFVWAVNPTHDANLNLSSNTSWHAILVLKTKGDVIDLLKILNAHGVTP